MTVGGKRPGILHEGGLNALRDSGRSRKVPAAKLTKTTETENESCCTDPSLVEVTNSHLKRGVKVQVYYSTEGDPGKRDGSRRAQGAEDDHPAGNISEKNKH